MFDNVHATMPRKMSFKAYKNMKIRMLQNDFRIKLTPEELNHADTLKTETQIDQFCIGIINNRWR